MDRKKLIMIFGGAFVAAGLLTWFLYSQTIAPKSEKMQAVYAATADLPAGTRLQRIHLKKISIPARDTPRAVVVDEKIALDRVLLYPIAMNEPVLTTRLSSISGAEGLAATIEPGKRAVSVSINDSTSAGGLILPRSHVDVLFTRTGAMAEAVTTTILEDVIVLSVGRVTELRSNLDPSDKAPAPAAVAPASSSTASRAVTLLVTPEQSRVLELARNQGKLNLALRNPKDQSHGEQAESATAENIDPNMYYRSARARLAARGRFPIGANVPDLRDDRAWSQLTGQDPGVKPSRAAEKKEPPKPRYIVDVFRGDKHVQETFQD